MLDQHWAPLATDFTPRHRWALTYSLRLIIKKASVIIPSYFIYLRPCRLGNQINRGKATPVVPTRLFSASLEMNHTCRHQRRGTRRKRRITRMLLRSKYVWRNYNFPWTTARCTIACPLTLFHVGPDSAQVNNHKTRQGHITAQHANTGQCHSGHEQERHCVYQLSSVTVCFSFSLLLQKPI